MWYVDLAYHILAGMRTRQQDTPSLATKMSISILQRLSVDLLLTIVDHLDGTSIVCLRYASRYFRATLRSLPKGLDPCTKWMIMARFEQDSMLDAERWKKVKKVTCALCKTKRTVAKFTGDLLREMWQTHLKPKYHSPK